MIVRNLAISSVTPLQTTCIYGWTTCDFMSFFNSILAISGRLMGDNERLCAMEPHLWFEVGLEPDTSNQHSDNIFFPT